MTTHSVRSALAALCLAGAALAQQPSASMPGAGLDQAVDSVLQRDNARNTLTAVFLSSRREMMAEVELRMTNADGGSRTVKLPVETWLRGQVFVYPVVTPANAKPIRIEIDPRNVYPDMDRSNNTWLAPAGG